jgi:cytochrome c
VSRLPDRHSTSSRVGRLCSGLALSLSIALAPWSSTHAFERYTAHGGPVKSLSLSADGRWLASTGFDYTTVLWSLPAFAEQRVLIGHEAAVNTAAFSPDGRYLVTASDDQTIRVWRLDGLPDADDAPQPRVLQGHTAKIVGLAFSPDGSRLASSSWDGSIGLWSVPEFDNLAFLKAHEGPVNAAVFSQSGQTLYSAGGDGHVRLWDVPARRYLRSLVKNGWGINVLEVDEDLDLVLYGTANGLMMGASLSGDRQPIEFSPEGPPVLALALDARKRHIAFGDAEGRVVIANARTGDIEHDFRAVKGPVWGIALTNSETAVVLAGLDDFITRIPLQDVSLPAVPVSAERRRFQPQGQDDNGALQFARKCSICHSLEADGKRRAGPTLHGIFGRRAGALPDYPYSPALAAADLVWNEQTIDALFSKGPDVVTPGSKMPLQRMTDAGDRQDLIDFLKRAGGGTLD